MAATKITCGMGGQSRFSALPAMLSQRLPLKDRPVVLDLMDHERALVDHYDREDGGWLEVLIEDRHAGPAETAAFRIDFPAWLKTLSRRNPRIAWKLALGEAGKNVARWFRVSAGRISQLRRELERSCQAFHGEPAAV